MAPRGARANAAGSALRAERSFLRTTGDCENGQVEQKRARNRLAQKAIRERRSAHIRYLEQQLAASQAETDSSRVQDLMNENAKLRDGLLAVRKKLFSLATTATALAGDLAPLLNLDDLKTNVEISAMTPESDISQRSTSHETMLASTEPPMFIRSEESGIPPENVGSMSGTETEDALHELQSLPIWDPIVDEMSLESGVEDRALERSGNNQIRSLQSCSGSCDLTNQSYQGQSHAVRPESDVNIVGGFLGLDDQSFLNSQSTLLTNPLGPPRGYYHSHFSDHLDYIQKLLRQNGYSQRYTSSPKVVEVLLSEFIKECWPVMKLWFAITDAYTTVRSIFWWKVSRSVHAMSEIPKSYIPTRIQQTLQYPSIIDFIPYSRIRDSLILNFEAYDVDQVICDMTEAYIIEKKNPSGYSAQSCNMTDLIQWSFQATISSLDHPATMTDWNDEARLNRAVGHFYSQLPKPFRIPNFKIHPNFFDKYPGLYDPTAVAENTTNVGMSSMKLDKAVPLNCEHADAYIKRLREDVLRNNLTISSASY